MNFRLRYLSHLVAIVCIIGFGTFGAEDASASNRVKRTIKIDGIERTYTAYIPKSAQRKRNLRVVFVFHPALGTSKFMEDATKLHELPDSNEFVVVYPEGFMRTWNAGACCGVAEMRDVDDVAFFRAMMRDLAAMVSIRPKAYLTGFSNGALMVYHLMCRAGDQVAATAPFAAYLPPDHLRDCHGGAVPLMHMHGDADPGSPVEGGSTKYLGNLPPALATVEAVARMNGANLRNPYYVNMPALGTRCREYSGRSEAAVARLCIIPMLGHVWPGMETFSANGKFGPARPDLKGSTAVLRFFLQH